MARHSNDVGARGRRDRGFTLIEVMVALAVFLVGLVGLPSLMIATMRASNEAQGTAAATALLQDKLEELQSLEYASIDSGGLEELDGNGETTGDPASLIYKRSWRVDADAPVLGAKTVTVTVTWVDRRLHAVTLSTIVAR